MRRLDVLPNRVVAIGDVSLLPGVAIATGGNKSWDYLQGIHDDKINYEHILQYRASQWTLK